MKSSAVGYGAKSAVSFSACAYDAIHIVNGIAAVDYTRCIGCSACARACPRNIITMVPFKAEQVMVVACSSKDFGKEVKGVCKTGCIGCKSCERATNGLFAIAENLPVLDYDHYQPDFDFSEAIEKCPMASLVYVGKPTAKDLADTAHEELPDKVEVDFKKGTVKNMKTDKTSEFKALPEFLMELMEEGGLIAYTKKKLSK